MAPSAFSLQQALGLARLPMSKRLLPLATTARRHAVVNRSSQWQSVRRYSVEALDQVEPPEYLSEGERKVFDMIKDRLQPTKLEVQDVSGGCGSMYALDIVSKQFQGLPVIKQHRLVNQALADEIKKWHGVQLKTKAP